MAFNPIYEYTKTQTGKGKDIFFNFRLYRVSIHIYKAHSCGVYLFLLYILIQLPRTICLNPVTEGRILISVITEVNPNPDKPEPKRFYSTAKQAIDFEEIILSGRG